MADDEYLRRHEHEELENRDGEKWRSISTYVLTALIGVVLGFAFKQVGI